MSTSEEIQEVRSAEEHRRVNPVRHSKEYIECLKHIRRLKHPTEEQIRAIVAMRASHAIRP